MENLTFALETAKFWLNWLTEKVKNLLEDKNYPEQCVKDTFVAIIKFFKETWPNVVEILKREAEEER